MRAGSWRRGRERKVRVETSVKGGRRSRRVWRNMRRRRRRRRRGRRGAGEGGNGVEEEVMKKGRERLDKEIVKGGIGELIFTCQRCLLIKL